MPDGGDLWVRAEKFETPVRRDDIGWGIGAGKYCRIWVSDFRSGHSPS